MSTTVNDWVQELERKARCFQQIGFLLPDVSQQRLVYERIGPQEAAPLYLVSRKIDETDLPQEIEVVGSDFARKVTIEGFDIYSPKTARASIVLGQLSQWNTLHRKLLELVRKNEF